MKSSALSPPTTNPGRPPPHLQKERVNPILAPPKGEGEEIS